MLQIKSLSKSYGTKTLFKDVTVSIGERARIALIGANGSGKSTLIKLILGKELPDKGSILISKNARIGHLAQELPPMQNRSVLEEVMSLDGRREEVLRLKTELEAKMAHTPDGVEMNETLLEYSRVLEAFDLLDEYRLPSRAKEILNGMGFLEKDFNRPLSEFSGGWLMRVVLSRVLLQNPDLLILDEPTNHLDLESLLWLEEFLQNYPGSILLVSHDRAFQNRLVNRVWEIAQERIESYTGNLDSYVLQKEERLASLVAAAANQDAKLAELRRFVERFGAKASKARQAQSRQKQIEKLEAEKVDLPTHDHHIEFKFPECIESGKDVLSIKNISLAYPDKTLFKNFSHLVRRGSRIAIVGVNGAGKTSLLRALANQLKISDGEIRLGHNVKMGYYSQMQAETLDLEKTIFDELSDAAPNLQVSQIRGIAGAFLFEGDAVYKQIKVLSGGEKARVALAKLLLTPHNLLIMDEPTNHLDVDSKQVLLDALLNFKGTLILVSHDRDFIAPLVNELFEIDQGRITPLIETYPEFLKRKTQEARLKLAPPKKESVRKNNEPEPALKKPSNNQIAQWKKELSTLEQKIEKSERLILDLNDQIATKDFSQNGTALNDLILRQSQAQLELDQMMLRWEELSEKLSSV